MTHPQQQLIQVLAIVDKHRRQIELSPGVGADVQRYGIAVCDDIKLDIELTLEAALSAGAVPQQEPQDWQPIATAPKDGTQIWVWDDRRGSNPALFVRDADAWVITYDDAVIQPTHWTPLPAPPRAVPSLPAPPQRFDINEFGVVMPSPEGDYVLYEQVAASLPAPQDRPYAALRGSLRGEETDAEFDAAVRAQFPAQKPQEKE